MMTVPRVSGPLVGFRAWTLRNGRLCPTGYSEGAAWVAGVNAARCVGGHRAPAHDCRCGLYALREWWMLGASDHGVWGAVVLWGRVEVHRRGFRAEFARIVALSSHPSQSRSHRVAVASVGRALMVPVVGIPELGAVASEFGVRLDGDGRAR